MVIHSIYGRTRLARTVKNLINHFINVLFYILIGISNRCCKDNFKNHKSNESNHSMLLPDGSLGPLIETIFKIILNFIPLFNNSGRFMTIIKVLHVNSTIGPAPHTVSV